MNLSGYLTFLLVLLRVSGMLLFNPILGRRNVPVRVNLGLSFFISLLLAGTVKGPALPDITLLDFLRYGLLELVVGMAAGLLMQLFLSVLIIGGDVIDMNLGIAMAKAFDPGTNASISISTSFLNALYILIFFTTNNHHTLLRLFRRTYEIIRRASATSAPSALLYPGLYGRYLHLFHEALPASGYSGGGDDHGRGMIMRVVPQINVFVVNIQVKLLVGLFTLIVLVPAFTGFVEHLIIACGERIAELWMLFPK